MSTNCLRFPQWFHVAPGKNRTCSTRQGPIPCGLYSFPPGFPNTLPLNNNLNHNEFPKVHNLSHLHFQPSHESRIHQFLPEFFAPLSHTLLEGQALRGGHRYTPLISLFNSQLHQQAPSERLAKILFSEIFLSVIKELTFWVPSVRAFVFNPNLGELMMVIYLLDPVKYQCLSCN